MRRLENVVNKKNVICQHSHIRWQITSFFVRRSHNEKGRFKITKIHLKYSDILPDTQTFPGIHHTTLYGPKMQSGRGTQWAVNQLKWDASIDSPKATLSSLQYKNWCQIQCFVGRTSIIVLCIPPSSRGCYLSLAPDTPRGALQVHLHNVVSWPASKIHVEIRKFLK